MTALAKPKTNVANTQTIKCQKCNQILIFGLGRCFFGPQATIQCRKCGNIHKND